MRITTVFFVILALLLSLPTCATAYGGGGADETVSALGTNKVCRCETLDEVRKGQRWHTRPDSLKKTAYEFVSSFPDADRNFLDSYDTGAFTKEEAIEILQWLKTNRLYMSDKALTLFNTLTGTSDTPSTSDTKVTSTSQSTHTTASAPSTHTTSTTPKDAPLESIKSKIFGIMIFQNDVRDMFAQLQEQHPQKNEFDIQGMVFRKIFTKQERDEISKDMETQLYIMGMINEVTK